MSVKSGATPHLAPAGRSNTVVIHLEFLSLPARCVRRVRASVIRRSGAKAQQSEPSSSAERPHRRLRNTRDSSPSLSRSDPPEWRRRRLRSRSSRRLRARTTTKTPSWPCRRLRRRLRTFRSSSSNRSWWPPPTTRSLAGGCPRPTSGGSGRSAQVSQLARRGHGGWRGRFCCAANAWAGLSGGQQRNKT